MFLILYFCNVSNYELNTGLASISSKSQNAGLNKKNGSISRALLPPTTEKIVVYQPL
jgi:hypothetical protein